MPYALETFTTDEFANPTSAVTISPAGSYIEFSGYAKTGNDDEYRILGSSSSFVQIVALTPTEILVRPGNSSDDMEFNTGYTQPAVDEDFTVRIKRLSLLEWECFLNGVSLGTKTINNRDLSITQFFNLNTSGQAFIGGCYYIEACTDGTGTATNRWENTTGTGSTWEDSIGSNDAPLSATFPTDDSQWVFFSAGAGGPSLDTIPSTAFPGQSRTVSGSGFGATQGTGGLTIGGASQTITSWSDASITFTTVLGANSYGTGKVVELTTDAGGTDTGAIEIVANTAGGFGVVTMSSPNTADESSVAYGATPTVVTGDQFEWEDFNTLGNLVIDAEGFVSSVDTEGTFRGRFWDASDGTWGSVNTFTASATDETAPTISSAAVPTAGNNIAVQMDESMQVGAGGSGGWTISLAGVSVSSAAVDGTDDTIVNLTPSRTLTDEDTLTIGYTQPGNGFQDQAATPNDLATLSGQAVTNNSTQQPPDVTGPVTQSVGVPTAGTYAIGDELSFTVNWDEAVTVTGTPALNLDIGGTSRQADYVSGSGSTALVFTYTVQAGDEDDNGIAVSSLTLEGGTLQDASSNNATLTLNSVGDTSGVLVDGVAPVISINALTTTDTTPVVTGSAGDATSLTLVVNSVTYNPTPSGGTWSQQLPELALDTYPMTLNGQDAAGNDAVEAQAVLTVVDEIVATGNGLFRPLFRASKKSTFKNLFR